MKRLQVGKLTSTILCVAILFFSVCTITYATIGLIQCLCSMFCPCTISTVLGAIIDHPTTPLTINRST